MHEPEKKSHRSVTKKVSLTSQSLNLNALWPKFFFFTDMDSNAYIEKKRNYEELNEQVPESEPYPK